MADGAVKITIEADGKKAIKSAKDLDNVFGQLGKHSNTAKIGVMDLAKSIGLVKVASAAFGFVTSGLGEIVKGLNESSATWQTFEGNMKGFGKSGAEIAKVKKELQSYAQATIYSSSDMASTYAQLSAVGTKNTTKLVEGFGGLAAAAEDPQQAMKSLSQQATQMAAKPQVAWEDFKIMLEQTPAGMAAVAKEMGMSLTDLVKKVQDGSVKTDDFFNAIAKAGTNDTFGKMATQFKTVGQAADGLKETITNKLQGAFDNMSQVGINAIVKLTDWIQKIDFDAIIASAVKFGTDVYNAIMKVVNYVQQNADWLGPLAVGIAAGVAAFMTINGAIKIATTTMAIFNAVMSINPFVAIIIGITAVVAGLVYFFTQTKTGQAVWKTFTDVLSNLWQSLVEIASTIWTAITNTFNTAVDIIKGVWSGIGEFFSGLWTGIVSGASAIWNTLATFFSGLWAGIVAVATNVWSVFGSGLTAIWNGIVNIAKGVWEMLKVVVMAPILILIDLLTGNWKQLGSDLKMIWGKIKSAAGDIWNGLKQVVMGVVDVVISYVSAVWNSIVSVTRRAFNAAKAAAVRAWNALKSGIVNLVNGLKNGAINAWNALKSGVINIANGIKRGAINAWNGMVNGVKRIIGNIKGAFNALRNIDLGEAGRKIINGFLKGLTHAFSSVKKFIGGIGNWIRKHKGPISYDKKLLIPAGNAIMNGLNDGLVNSFGKVKSSIASITEGIANSAVITMPAIEDSAFNKSLKQINNTLNSNRLSAGLSFAGITAESATGIGRGVTPTNSVVNDYSNTATTTVQTAKESNDKVLEALNKIANNRPVAVVDGSSFAPAYEQYGSTETARRSQMKGRGLAVDSKF